MKDIQNILTQVFLIVKKNSEILDATGGRFNMFGMLGLDHYENTHSSIIKEILDPTGSHGLKTIFLKSFINTISKYFIQNDVFVKFLEDFKSDNATVQKEALTPDGRLDILIQDNEKRALIIENKIYAVDQWKQLKRYNIYAADKWGKDNYKILYLTLLGNEASKDSGEDVEYIQISYLYHIYFWLEECVKLAARFPLIRETLIQYINHIKKLTNQDMSAKVVDEVVKTMSLTEENIQAAFAIAGNIGALKDNLISSYFNKQLTEIASELNIKVKTELIGRQIYAGFGFLIPNWEHFYIRFEFDGSDYMKLGFMYSLLDVKKKPEATIKILYSKFSRHNQNVSIPCGWTYMSKFQNWNHDAYLAILNGEMKDEIKRVVTNLIEQGKNLEM